MRIDGGLVLLEKQKTLNGVLVPVAYDQGAHDYVPSFTTRRGASTLSQSYTEGVHCEAWSVGQTPRFIPEKHDWQS